MEILVTGCTDTHVNLPTRVQDVQFVSTPELLTRALREQGHSVQHRALIQKQAQGVAWVEMADQKFDLVVCFLYPPDRHARHQFTVEGFLSLMPENVILAVDDWSCGDVLKQWALKLSKNEMKEGHFKNDPEAAEEWLKSKQWFAPMFQWGSVQKLADHIGVTRLLGADFTPMVMDLCKPGEPPNEKPFYGRRARAWVNASYHPDSHAWAARNTTWPLVSYGCKLYGQQRKLESEVTELYGHYVGALAPEYVCSGTGWWRPRLTFAAHAGAVLGTSKEELCGICSHIPPASIELMSDAEIETLAKAQLEALNDCGGTMDTLKRAVDMLVEVFNYG